jgi:hypothetical protein
MPADTLTQEALLQSLEGVRRVAVRLRSPVSRDHATVVSVPAAVERALSLPIKLTR